MMLILPQDIQCAKTDLERASAPHQQRACCPLLFTSSRNAIKTFHDKFHFPKLCTRKAGWTPGMVISTASCRQIWPYADPEKIGDKM
jgi:hypothetical protein